MSNEFGLSFASDDANSLTGAASTLFAGAIAGRFFFNVPFGIGAACGFDSEEEEEEEEEEDEADAEEDDEEEEEDDRDEDGSPSTTSMT